MKKINNLFKTIILGSFMFGTSFPIFAQQNLAENCNDAKVLPIPALTCSQNNEIIKKPTKWFRLTTNSETLQIEITQQGNQSAEITKVSVLDGTCDNISPIKETTQLNQDGSLSLTVENLTVGQTCFIKIEREKIPQGNFQMCVKEVEIVTPTFFGLPHSTLGKAVLSADNDLMILSNVGESGNDGISIGLGQESKGLHIEGDFPLLSSIPLGATLKSVVIGPSNGQLNQVLGSITLERVDGGFQETPIFSGAPTYSVTLVNDGVEVYHQTDITGPVLVSQSQNAFLGLCFHGINGLQISRGKRKEKSQVQLLNGGPTFLVDAIIYHPVNAPDIENGISEIKILSKSIDNISIDAEWLMMYKDMPNKVLGDATFKSVVGGNLVIENMGTGGNDGVQIDFIDFIVRKIVTSFEYNVELGNENNYQMGATFTSSTKGSVDGVEEKTISSIMMKRVPSGLEITPDFNGIGASTYGLQLYKDGNLIFSKQGLTGIAGIVQLNNGGNNPNHTKIGFDENKYFCSFGKIKKINIVGSGNIFADEIVFTQENATKTVDFFNSVTSLTQDIPTFTITDEQVNPSASSLRLNTSVESNSQSITVDKLEIYPNPFNNVINIRFSVPNTEKITLEMYSITGKHIATLFNDIAKENQFYDINFNTQDLPNGIYFYNWKTSTSTYSEKMFKMNNN